MVFQMWTLMVPAAGWLAPKVWEVGAVRLEEVEARELHLGQVVPGILMTWDTGHVSTAHMPMLSQLPFAKCASNAVSLISQCVLDDKNLVLAKLADCKRGATGISRGNIGLPIGRSANDQISICSEKREEALALKGFCVSWNVNVNSLLSVSSLVL